jgi:hypothetical protein
MRRDMRYSRRKQCARHPSIRARCEGRGGAPAADAEREPAPADGEPAADLYADRVDGDDDNPRETTGQLLEGLG